MLRQHLHHEYNLTTVPMYMWLRAYTIQYINPYPNKYVSVYMYLYRIHLPLPPPPLIQDVSLIVSKHRSILDDN